jgi:hypothetical protein
MDFALALVILAAALAALAVPLYRARSQAQYVSVSTLDDALAQRDGIYATLRDLELDHELGKLADADYASLRERYMLRAAEILRQIDTLRGIGAGADASAEIEREVSALRRTRGELPRATFRTRGEAEPDGEGARFCPNCGAPAEVDDKFCRRCGQALKSE